MKKVEIHLGYDVGTGKPVAIPLRHMVITGQTQEAGKTTALEALIARYSEKWSSGGSTTMFTRTEEAMPSNRKATKDEWISIAQAAPRLRVDHTSVGRYARAGLLGKTAVRPHKGHIRRMITLAGLRRFMDRLKKAK